MRRPIQGATALLLFVFLAVAGFSQASNKGFASTYPLALEGSKTASGEIYISTELTACHASLPFNTLVKVTNLRNKKTVTVRVNDRFAFRNSRVIDISKTAADMIDLFGEITPQVSIEVLGTADATMLADVQKKQDAAKNATAPSEKTAVVKTTTPKKEKKTEVVASAPAPVSTPVTTAAVPVTASASTAGTDGGFLSGIKLSIPTVSVQDITNLATVTIKYISLSLFK
ncbi:MAG TPA: septal ring lytic transglycosylase RlpA family protein [Bacteroidia bacterium]|nr:septal ring lytic transglycosylase RlpA family protein [Bacteroidia bacterium]